jgi:hypothetical protein
MRQVDNYKVELKADVKATRDEMAKVALAIMKKELSHRSGYTGRGATKKAKPTAEGEPPSKRTGLLFRSVKARKWNKEDRYGAYVGLPKTKRGYGVAFYGVILESSNRTGSGNGFSGKRRTLTGGKTSSKGSMPQRAPGVHKWAAPAFHEFEPLVNPIIEKNLGGVK